MIITGKSPSRTVPAAILLSWTPMFDAHHVEVEPNQPCPFSQDLGSALLPSTIAGNLDPPAGAGDVDFYRFQGPPGSGIRIDMESAATGRGTLADPLLGLFDSACTPLAVDDDGGIGTNSLLFMRLPPDGVLVAAATSCCDHRFEGNLGVLGTYEITISPQEFAGSIEGRAVDAVNGEPLPGSRFPFAFAQLFRCEAGICSERVSSQAVDFEGRFRFDAAWIEAELLPGTYQVLLSASAFVDTRTVPFELAAEEHLDLGEIGLAPLRRIAGVSGRLLDAVTGVPLPGDGAPFARAELFRCDETGCFEAASQAADSLGRFRFEQDAAGGPLVVGTYQVRASAEEYEPASSEPFSVAENELAHTGDLRLSPFPVRITEGRTCGDLPPDGGICWFSVRFTNRLDESVEGAAWSLVEALGTGSLHGETRFQTGLPRRIRLAPGGHQVEIFGFFVPGAVETGATSCVEVWFGLGAQLPFFETSGHRDLFCVEKEGPGALRVLSGKESRKLRAIKTR